MPFNQNVNLNYRTTGLDQAISKTDLLFEKTSRLAQQKLQLDNTAALKSMKVLEQGIKSLSNLKIKLAVDDSSVVSLFDAILKKKEVEIKVNISGFEALNSELTKSINKMEILATKAGRCWTVLK